MAPNTSFSVILLVLCCGFTFALEEVLGSRHPVKADSELSDEQGSGKLYFTGPGYTINLIPQAILLGLLSFLAVYFLGLDLFGSSGGSAPSAYGAPSVAYGAPEASYGAPAPASYSAPASGYDAPSPSYSASGRFYDTSDSLYGTEDSRRKRSAF